MPRVPVLHTGCRKSSACIPHHFNVDATTKLRFIVTMKMDTFVVLAKMFCLFGGTSLITLQTGLSQWSNVDTGPSFVQWVMIIGGAIGAGLLATSGFISQSFGNYLKARNENGNNGATQTYSVNTVVK